MFFESRKRQDFADGVSPPSDPVVSQGGNRQARRWRAWRRSAQDVTRAWNAWLAADSRERGESYRRYVAALSQEERAAAEIKRSINLSASA